MTSISFFLKHCLMLLPISRLTFVFSGVSNSGVMDKIEAGGTFKKLLFQYAYN